MPARARDPGRSLSNAHVIAPIHNDVLRRLNGFLWAENGPASAAN